MESMMKIRNLATAGVSVLALMVGAAQAQTKGFRVNVPFEFVVGRETIPAGNYLVERLLGKRTAKDITGIVVIKTPDHRVYKAVVTSLSIERRIQQGGTSQLVFTRFQGKRHLDQVWVAGDEVAHQLATLPQATIRSEASLPSEVIVASEIRKRSADKTISRNN